MRTHVRTHVLTSAYAYVRTVCVRMRTHVRTQDTHSTNTVRTHNTHMRTHVRNVRMRTHPVLSCRAQLRKLGCF